MDDEVVVLLVAALFVAGIVGLYLGRTVNKEGAGFWLGLLLGPIGWIIVLLLPREGTEGSATASATPSTELVPDELNYERDLSLDGYKIWLVKKYSIERNEALNQIVCGDRLFLTIEDALTFVDSVEQEELKQQEIKRAFAEKAKQEEAIERAERAEAQRQERAQEQARFRKQAPWVYSVIVLALIVIVAVNDLANRTGENEKAPSTYSAKVTTARDDIADLYIVIGKLKTQRSQLRKRKGDSTWSPEVEAELEAVSSEI